MSIAGGGSRSALPIVGMDQELEALLHSASSPQSARWLITGARGIGKTRLAREVALRLAAKTSFSSLGNRSGVGPFDPARKLRMLARDTELLVLDDIDMVQLKHPRYALNALSELPRMTIVMTAAESPHISWNSLTGPSTPTNRIHLRGLTDEASRALLTEAGAIDRPDSEIPGKGAFDRALGAATGNPRLLLEWAHWNREDPLVAGLYERSGFQVELTQTANDGGIDIYAFQKAPFGSFLTIVDCKHFRPDRPVQVGLIRQLYGTVMATDASVGVIATTSYLTKGAKSFQAEREHRLGLQDFVSIKEMLQKPRG
jgi:restriction endonuclease